MFLLVASFATEPPAGALEVLASQPTCRHLRFAQSTEEAARWVLVAEFPSAAGYRAAIGPFEVRTTVVPWLSTALPDSGVHEVLLSADAGDIVRHEPTVIPGR